MASAINQNLFLRTNKEQILQNACSLELQLFGSNLY